ncbi:methyltransferase [Gottfriedia sp. OAE603]|uniref:methyltransferase n=1 Tax=Gottfriedia sp. OAE603 TaxID=2663872 RepID=UPI001789A29C
MKEKYYDELLNIKTEGEQVGFNESLHYHRYEPTPYVALEILFKQYELKSTDRIVDFGCGKGRLNFYIHYLFNSSVIGIEMNETFYLEAIQNKKHYVKKDDKKIQFYHCLAENYEIQPLENHFYFFNPFSIQIFMKIIKNILLSVEKTRREIEVVLYYVSDEYIYFLEYQTALELKKEIIIPGLYERNQNERFLVYHLVY